MKKILQHKFVEYVPDALEDGVLYVSIKYKTGVHLCICGCGNKVVTPLSPNDWKLTFDGSTVTLHPSIGNWSFPCRTHYFITNNKIDNMGQWSKTRIDSGRKYERERREKYYKKKGKDDNKF
jgi:hypothetical protein